MPRYVRELATSFKPGDHWEPLEVLCTPQQCVWQALQGLLTVCVAGAARVAHSVWQALQGLHSLLSEAPIGLGSPLNDPSFMPSAAWSELEVRVG